MGMATVVVVVKVVGKKYIVVFLLEFACFQLQLKRNHCHEYHHLGF